MAHARLLDALRRVVLDLPPSAIDALNAALTSGPPDDPEAVRRTAIHSVVLPGPRAAVGEMIDTWRRCAPDLPPHALGLALQVASHCEQAREEASKIELVWSGPNTGEPLRRTDQALLQVIQTAGQELLLVTFAAYKVPRVADALLQAAHRGIIIRFIAESCVESGGKVGFDAVAALGPEVPALAEVYVWPHDRRPLDAAGKHGSLHAKCAVADAELLLLSSANLTGFAFDLNMEMGLLVHGGTLPARVAGHFHQLIRSGLLVRSRA